MIASLSGTVLSHSEQSLILDVHGVGYRILAPTSVLSQVESHTSLSLHTHLAVRETSMELFGFETESDVQFFELLISVSGIGPRSALAIMNLAPTEVLVPAIAKGDTSYLTKVSGIGAKSAGKIVVELKDKLAGFSFEDTMQGESDGDVLDALSALGYSLAEAREALQAIPESATSTSDKIKEALKQLSAPH